MPSETRQDLNCDEALKRRLQTHLNQFSLTDNGPAEGRSAAVALTIVDGAYGANLSGLEEYAEWQSHAAVILTKRSLKLRSHPGQWALPGGRIDTGESAEHAALREMDEEVGLRLSPDCVLGRLDDFVTRSGYVITPILIWAGPTPALTANEAEVASIHRIPLSELLRDDGPMLEPVEGGGAPILKMPIGKGFIAAPTAAILYQFREVCLLGNEVRVAHFEQPAFAWR